MKINLSLKLVIFILLVIFIQGASSGEDLKTEDMNLIKNYKYNEQYYHLIEKSLDLNCLLGKSVDVIKYLKSKGCKGIVVNANQTFNEDTMNKKVVDENTYYQGSYALEHNKNSVILVTYCICKSVEVKMNASMEEKSEQYKNKKVISIEVTKRIVDISKVTEIMLKVPTIY